MRQEKKIEKKDSYYKITTHFEQTEDYNDNKKKSLDVYKVIMSNDDIFDNNIVIQIQHNE